MASYYDVDAILTDAQVTIHVPRPIRAYAAYTCVLESTMHLRAVCSCSRLFGGQHERRRQAGVQGRTAPLARRDACYFVRPRCFGLKALQHH
jgi:hypothetical protein